MSRPDFREVSALPRGYQGVTILPLIGSEKAIRAEVAGRVVTLPKSVLIRCGGHIWAPSWSIRSALEYETGRKG